VKYLVPILLVIIIILTAALFFFMGRSANTGQSTQISLPNQASQEIVSPTSSLTPTPTQMPSKKVTAGGIMSFPKYELTLPADWQVTR
jgi:hypothetical protein